MDLFKLSPALEYSARVHRDQKRKGPDPSPYIAHPVFVGMCLQKYRFDEDTVIAGILHDTIEDAGVLPQDIERVFGKQVRIMIESLSEKKSPSMTKEEKKRTWRKRKNEYVEQIRNSTPQIRAISTFDLLHNLMDLKNLIETERENSFKYFNAPIENKIRYSRELVEIYKKDLKHLPHMADVV